MDAIAKERRRRLLLARAMRLDRAQLGLEDAAVRAIRSDLEAARKEVIAELVTIGPEWRAAQLRSTLAELERQMLVWEGKATTTAHDAIAKSGVAGADFTYESVRGGAVDLGLGPVISEQTLAATYSMSALLISDVSAEVIRKVNLQLRRAALTLANPFDVMKTLGPVVGKGTFASEFLRAEAIVRTEIGRASSVAQHATLTDLASRDPKLGREWLTVMDVRTRPAHARANGQKRDVDMPFDVGGEALMYPRDPKGTAANTINCRCNAIPGHPDWD